MDSRRWNCDMFAVVFICLWMVIIPSFFFLIIFFFCFCSDSAEITAKRITKKHLFSTPKDTCSSCAVHFVSECDCNVRQIQMKASMTHIFMKLYGVGWPAQLWKRNTAVGKMKKRSKKKRTTKSLLAPDKHNLFICKRISAKWQSFCSSVRYTYFLLLFWT